MRNWKTMAKSRSNYAPSILQSEEDQAYCFLCGRCDKKLDRHEVFPGPFRNKSKELGLWVTLCHDTCHEGRNGAQYNAAVAKRIKGKAQRVAMRVYGWTTEDFIREFGKNYL